MGKGYTVVGQKVSINVGLNGSVRGYTEITITPTTPDLKTVWLNARAMNVTGVTLRSQNDGSTPLSFSLLPPSPPTMTNTNDIHTYPEMKRAMWRGALEGEEGELGIGLPPGLVNKVAQSVAPTPRDDVKKDDEYEQIVFVVDYEVTQPGPGIVVVGPDETNPSRFPHVFTSGLTEIAARNWVPCSDHAKERCTWEIEFIVPRVLYSGSDSTKSKANNEVNDAAEDEDDEDEEEDGEDEDQIEWPIRVAASGELIEQVVHPDRSDRVIWHYAQVTPVSVQHIAWAVGPFVVTEIARAKLVDENGVEEEEDDAEHLIEDEGPKLNALCLPGREEEMINCVGILRRAMDYYSSTFGSYPFTTYAICFVDSLASGAPTFHSAAMTLVSSDILHPATIIDQAYETRHVLAHALAVQWSGINLIARTPSDSWLVVGLALYLTSLFIKTVWGNNEFRFRLKKDILRCVSQDVQREPISVPARLTQPEPAQLQFIALKAPLVLHILDKHLRNSGTSLGLDKVIPKLFLDAITGELGSTPATQNTLSTNSFMRLCRKACGTSMDSLRSFFDQWVYGSGCPTFIISAMFNRKRMAVEISIKQECLAYNWANMAPKEEMGHLRPISLFEGQMTIRIHEADGTPYEHVLSIQDAFKKHEVPFNTKYKRIRRNTKRYQAKQAAAQAAAEGDKDAAEDVALMDIGFTLKSWEEEQERERWQVADWTEQDDAIMAQATYEWIRIDANMEWIAGIQFEQPDFMWISQLQRDRDVVAQMEAVHALSRLPSAIVSSNLTKCILVQSYFIRVRMEAALALISCATTAHNFLGLFHLFKLFQTKYCFQPDTETPDPLGFRCIPKTNDFTDIGEYFLKKTLLTAISMVRDDKGQTPPVVLQFLLDLLQYNDNLGNKFSDTFYIVSIMNALSHALVAVQTKESSMLGGGDQSYMEEVEGNQFLEPAIQEIERYMNADRLVPSYHNAITVAGIEWKLKLTLACLIPEDRMSFFVYTRDGNYPPVRIAAFDALLLLNPLQDHFPLVRYLFSVLREDSSRLVQRRLGEAILESLPILASMHDLAPPEVVLEEEEGKKKDKDPVEKQLKALRKKPGRSLNFRQCLLQTLTFADIDPEVRETVLKICETTIKAGEEPIPKMRFRMPALNTVNESPSALTPVTPGGLPRLKITSSQREGLPRITLPRAAGTENHEDYGDDVPRKVKLKASTKVEQAQASGMTMSDVTACKSMIKKLLREKCSYMFRTPVDPIKAGAPRYFDIIKNPMDISTMSAKLAAGQYPDRWAFRDDFKLIISNAVAYNMTGPVVDLAKKLEGIFDKQWDRIETTLKAMEAPGSHEGRPPKPPKQAIDGPSAVEVAPDSEPVNTEDGLMPEPAALPPLPASTQAPVNHAFDTYNPFAPPPSSSLPPPPQPPQQQPQHSASASPAPPAQAARESTPASTALPEPSPAATPVTSVSSMPLGLSFKIKAPAPPPPLAPEPASSSTGTALEAAESSKPSSFKITFGASSKPNKAPKMSRSSSASSFNNDHDRNGFGGDENNGVTRLTLKKDKPHRKEINYAEPEDDFPLPPTAAAVPAKTEALNGPELPHPSKWIDGEESIDVKKVKAVISKMQGMREAFFFLVPVDPIALPTYYNEIAQPMDLQTMTRKLDYGQYETYGEVFDDFDLIVANCKQFNTPNTEPIFHVMALDRAWRQEWEKASKLSYNTKRAVSSLLKTLMKEGAAQPFLESIWTIIQYVPNYFDIIPNGNERDLGTIKANLEKDVYTSIEQLEADVDLMLDNCFTYNAPDNQVYKSGEALQKMFKQGIAKIKLQDANGGGVGKKRAGDKASGGAFKKIKF
ncbi:hypothetical protein OIO90_000500 [Microbotryomycetes sp. JL221]|nr:hypothetical protein OIO90_000500 [Microbotryomycetes sp. JL221]